MFRQVLAALLIVASPVASAVLLDAGERQAVLALNAERDQAHEGRPAGVPKSYDWYSRPRLKLGNRPGEFKAMTGWGHVFWDDTSGEGVARLGLRGMRVYMCHGEQHRWRLVQSGDIYGRQFDADFKDNLSVPTQIRVGGRGIFTAAFERSTAFHFWPAMGRVALPDEPLCGFVALVEAMRVAGDGEPGQPRAGELLLGMGADYWLDKYAAWDGAGANAGIALGKLKRISDQWAWYGVSTASDEDVASLVSEGFTIER